MKVRHGSNGNTVFTDHLVAASVRMEILYHNANVIYDRKQIVNERDAENENKIWMYIEKKKNLYTQQKIARYF